MFRSWLKGRPIRVPWAKNPLSKPADTKKYPQEHYRLRQALLSMIPYSVNPQGSPKTPTPRLLAPAPKLLPDLNRKILLKEQQH
ncbi:hypothetical protein AALP_AAs46487U000100 [Arabis alpina]|uniref:Uncharacterized protein n=1 Tax=Arabis alpina TaxID=50452 RepID=A0A087FWN0_ARAAL|nr:hypothetical protein AALP_AAs46487U000100 [Arabis alpina]